MVKVNGITCRVVLDAGGGISYIPSTLVRELKKPLIGADCKHIETM